MAKEVTVRCHHRGRTNDYTGTIQYLCSSVFGYTLDCGHSWNNKINMNPKTGPGLVKALNQSVKETHGCCYDQDYYELVNN